MGQILSSAVGGTASSGGIQMPNRTGAGGSYSRLNTSDSSSPSPTTANSATSTNATGSTSAAKKDEAKRQMTFMELMVVLRPYFYPDATSDKLRALTTWILLIGHKSCNVISPYYLAQATSALQQSNYISAVHSVLIYCSINFGSVLFKELQSLVYMKVKQNANIDLARRTFAHIHALSLHWHLSKKMGDVIRNMDRGTSAADTLMSTIFLSLLPSFFECIAVAIIFFVRFNLWSMSIITISGLVAYVIVTLVITEKRRKYREEVIKYDKEYHNIATDSIVNYETVKYFTSEKYEMGRFSDAVSTYQKCTYLSWVMIAAINISQQLVVASTVAGALYVTCKAVVYGDMDVGDFVGVNAYILGMFAPLGWLGSQYGAILYALVEAKVLSELLVEPIEIEDVDGAGPIPIPRLGFKATERSQPSDSPATCHRCKRLVSSTSWRFCAYCGADLKSSDIALTTTSTSTSNASSRGNTTKGVSVELQDVYFHYPSQPAARGLKGVSVMCPAGQTTAFVGHTGAGKTTISRLLFRFYDPLQGRVLINGFDVRDFTQLSVRNCIGVVPQDTVLFNDTILFNIKYGRHDATMEEVVAAAEAAQILPFIQSLPDRWDTKVGERGLKLSGGEKQRIAIARCLLKDPPIVLLDEATSALDTLTEHSVQDALNTLGKQRTVIVIAHRLSTIKHADQIVVMHEGTIVERGTHDELLAIPGGHYAQLWNMQVRGSLAESDSTSTTATAGTVESVVGKKA